MYDDLPVAQLVSPNLIDFTRTKGRRRRPPIVLMASDHTLIMSGPFFKEMAEG